MGRMRKCFRGVLNVCTFNTKQEPVKSVPGPASGSMTSLGRVSSAGSGTSGRSSARSQDVYPSSGVSSVSGSRLSLDVASTASDEWRHLREAMKVVRGSFSQFEMAGQFAGAQCTSISYVALCWASIVSPVQWTPGHVDDVMRTGDTMHAVFRRNMQVSKHRDGRVAIDDLPDYFPVEIQGVQLGAYKGESVTAFLTITPALSEFAKEAQIPALRDCLEQKNAGGDGVGRGFLVTVGEFTYMVTRTDTGRWVLFDSHGCLWYGARDSRKTASMATFPTADGVVEAFLRMHGDGTQAEVVDISIHHEPVSTAVPQPQQPTVDRRFNASRLSWPSGEESRYPASSAYTEMEGDYEPESALTWMTAAYEDTAPSEVMTPKTATRLARATRTINRPHPLGDVSVEDVPDCDVIRLTF